LYDTEEGDFMVTSWGDFLEGWEERAEDVHMDDDRQASTHYADSYNFSSEELESLGLSANDSAALVSLVGSVSSAEEIYRAMDSVDKLMGGHGVETLQDENAYVDSYWRNAIALYVNMGETYQTTLLYDTESSVFLITSYGDFYEGWEAAQSEPTYPEPAAEGLPDIDWYDNYVIRDAKGHTGEYVLLYEDEVLEESAEFEELVQFAIAHMDHFRNWLDLYYLTDQDTVFVLREVDAIENVEDIDLGDFVSL